MLTASHQSTAPAEYSADGRTFRKAEVSRISIVHVVGARPNFVKMAPVSHQLRQRLPTARHVVVHTGQHYDREMSQIFLDDLDLPAPDHVLGVGSGSHGAQTARALAGIEAVLQVEQPDMVIVSGDVNSTLAGALAAVKLEIPLAHIEAGLRSFDRTMPEEINRMLVDQVARWCFIHSPEADGNLRREGVEGERIFFVGNTMIDTLVRLQPRIEASTIHERLGLVPKQYVVATLHRPRLVDGPLFERALASLQRLASEIPVVYPVHPRARKRLAKPATNGADLHLVEPLGYIDFLALEMHAAGVITDSGGVQEETTYLHVPCFTLRENTERPITTSHGTNRVLGLQPEAIDTIPALLQKSILTTEPPPGWDGRAAERVADTLVRVLGEERDLALTGTDRPGIEIKPSVIRQA
jgi:UDP-N-acetylglucosamine 2-epimerase (non-hydrolysing)